MNAREYLTKELARAKLSLMRAERKPGVHHHEVSNIKAKMAALQEALDCVDAVQKQNMIKG